MLLMNVIQWNKDSHGLFDYDMREIKNQYFKFKTSKDVFRCDHELIFKNPGEIIQEEPNRKH